MTHTAVENGASADALARLSHPLDPQAINAQQPMGPGAVYTPWVVLWLLVYQRLHANAPMSDAVAELLRSTEVLPPNRRVDEHTLSANTGAYGRARARLHPRIPDRPAGHASDTPA